jgi:hypothetical protein
MNVRPHAALKAHERNQNGSSSGTTQAGSSWCGERSG